MERDRLAALVALARAAGAQVIADTVETQEQFEIAAQLGCDLAQGFYFQKALSVEEATSLAAAQSNQAAKEGD